MTDKSEIFNKAGRMFKRFGIRSITMDDISHELGISKKTLYKQIPDKKDLVIKVVSDDFKYYKKSLDAVLNSKSDAIEQLIRIHELSLELHKDFSPSIEYDLKKYYNELYEKTRKGYLEMMEKALSHNIEYGISSGIYRKGINTKVISKMFVGRIEQASRSLAYSLDEYLSPGFSKEVLVFQLMGLVNRQGESTLKKYLSNLESFN